MGNCICKSDGTSLVLDALSSTKGSMVKLNVSDFHTKSLIGAGGTSEVYLVKSNRDKKYYAMKVIKKRSIKTPIDAKHIKSERQILEKLKHPFLVKFHYAFQNSFNLYLILEYAQGGDLFTHITNKKAVSEMDCKFYAAEIVWALEYLHSNGIIFRGLKPEDVLLDSKGHIKLSDFGLAKSWNSVTSTFCGSPLYLAPEIIMGQKQEYAVDWWSLGVLIYEMLIGQPPFWSHDNKKLLKKILDKELKLSDNISNEAKDIIDKLLDINQKTRLGSRDVEDIKDHPFFDDINWMDIQLKRQVPPFRPLLSSNSDLKYVDKIYKHIEFTKRESSKGFKSDSDFSNFTYHGNPSMVVQEELDETSNTLSI